MTERRALAPWGLAGGSPGKGGENLLITGKKKISLPAKVTFELLPGQTLSIRTPGGGGWGFPARKRGAKKRRTLSRGDGR